MNRKIHRLLAALACALSLGAAATASQAALVTSRFDGTVSGYNWGFVDPAGSALDEDHPLGTSVRWNMTFDDSFLSFGPGSVFSQPAPEVSGSLYLGSDEYTFTSWNWFSLTYDGNTGAILRYGPQILATGPATSDGADFFGFFWSFAPDFSLVGNQNIGFGYSSDFVTSYAYLVASGNHSVTPVNAIPEPSTAWLALPALMFLWRRRRRE